MVLRFFLYTQPLGDTGHLFNEKKLKELPRENNLISRKKGKIVQIDHFNITNPESRSALNSDDQREGNSPDSLIYCTESVKPQTGSCLLVGTSALTRGLGDFRRRVAMN